MNMDRGSRKVRIGKKIRLLMLAAVLLGALGAWHFWPRSAAYDGDGGPATQAGLWAPEGLAMDAHGNLFIGDPRACVVRELHADSGRTTIMAGNGRACTLHYGETWEDYLSHIDDRQNLAMDGQGNLFIASQGDSRVREVHAGSGIITTVAGNDRICDSYTPCGDGGPATRAAFAYIAGIAVDGHGDLFVVDYMASRVREVHAGSGIITTVAGAWPHCSGSVRHCADWLATQPFCSGARGICADGVPATRAMLYGPGAIAMDQHGNLFISQNTTPYSVRHGVREVHAGSGIIATVRGLGDHDPITKTLSPVSLAVDGQGNLFISDARSNEVLELHVGSGVITTVAGDGHACALTTRCGDGGPATGAALNPGALVLDGHGHLYIADALGYRVRKVDLRTGIITTVAGPRVG